MAEQPSVYQQLKTAGVPLDNHESDLYAQVTPDSTKIVNTYKFRMNVSTFYSEVDKKLWYDIPFAYDPFWEAKAR